MPLDSGNWPVMAASDVPWSADNQIPRPMTRADMDRVIEEFVASVRMGLEAGFDMIELHAAHGYLLSSFITPLTNKRTDDYGGSLENRLRFPLEVFRGDARSLARGQADVGPHLGQRLDGRSGHHARRCGRDRPRLLGGGRGSDRRLRRPDLGRLPAHLRPYVPDPLRRPGPQRGPGHHHGGRQHLRARSCQLDPRRRPRRSGRARPSASDRPELDSARRRRSRTIAASPSRPRISAAWPSSPATWRAKRSSRHEIGRDATRSSPAAAPGSAPPSPKRWRPKAPRLAAWGAASTSSAPTASPPT